MNKQSYLLEVLAEECAEVAHIKSKIIRFGLHVQNPVDGVSNEVQLFKEIADLYATVDMLRAEVPSFDALFIVLDEHKEDKVRKVEKFMQCSIDSGILEPQTRWVIIQTHKTQFGNSTEEELCSFDTESEARQESKKQTYQFRGNSTGSVSCKIMEVPR